MRTRKTAWILFAVAAIVAVVVALFDWNWLRGPLAGYLSAKFGRAVTIYGNLRGEFSLTPRLTADDVTLANAPWGTDPAMARAQQVSVRVDVLSLFGPTVSLLELSLVQPVLLLEREAGGRQNWDFGGVPKIPRIGSLDIDRGVVRFLNSAYGTDVSVNVASAPVENGEMPVKFKGAGRLRKNDFSIEGTAATLLALESSDRQYRVDVQAKAGASSAQFKGSIVPARIDNVDGVLSLQGRDLSQLYPIIPVPFPWTPPYHLRGNLKHGSGLWSFREASGKVGESDLAGRLDVDRTNQRPRVDADIVSQNLNYKDLGGLIGLPPPGGPQPRTTAQNKEAAKRERTGQALPTKPYDLEGLRAIDAKVHLKGKRLLATDLPLDNLNAVMDLKDGVLTLHPLDFGIAGGHAALMLTMDARAKVIKTTGDATVRNVELKQIVPSLKPPKGSAGKVGGRANFNATGNSVADMFATSNGEVALISSGGDASELSIVLTNLDLARAAALLLRGDANTPIRCMVADFVSENGVMDAKTLVIDTDAEKILGSGKVDFRQERYDLTFSAQSKRPSLIALRGPIVIDGTFKNPNVHPATGPIVARVGASVALGILNPLAALLPLIDLGGAQDADCRALIAEASANVKARTTAQKAANRSR